MASFDLENVSETSSLVQKFKQALTKSTGQMIVGFIAQKMKKVAGEATKDLEFNLENGQAVTLVVRSNGDVVRVKLNGKDTPLKADLFHFSADSFTAIGPVSGNKYSLSANEADKKSPAAVFLKAVGEIGQRVRQAQPAFDKRRAAEKVQVSKQTISNGGGSRGKSTSAKEVRLKLESLDNTIIQKTALRDDLKEKVKARNLQINQVQAGVHEANPGVFS